MIKIIDYTGELTQKVIGICMDNIENNISHMVTMANISTIVIEMCQNMINYSKTNKSQCRDIEPTGAINVEKDNNGIYYITGTNIVSIEDKEKIEPKVIEIKSLDNAGIKKRYKELRRSGKNTHEKGGGIGTYEIAKICDTIDYTFENINDDKYYFTLKCKVKSKAKNEAKIKTILVVEDSIKLQEEVKNIFEAKQYKIYLASKADEALDILDEKLIDLILLNDKLKSSNGIELLTENNNKIINLLKIPVFITSNNTTSDLIKIGLNNGAKDILSKPYNIEELIIKVDMWIDSKEKKLKHKEELKILNEYKNAVDESAIVTKTDAKGFITYINQQFCDISGYSKDELVGKNHNIIRHEDTQISIYKDMWHTIKKLKKPWKGEIKNKAKDGSAYWVQSFIKPILDIDNNIIEYISIRVDITALKNGEKR